MSRDNNKLNEARTHALEAIIRFNNQSQQGTLHSELQEFEREPRSSTYFESSNQDVSLSLNLTVEASVDQLEKQCDYLNTLQQKQVDYCKALVRNLESQLTLLKNFESRQRTSGNLLDSTSLPDFPSEELDELKTQFERQEIYSRDNNILIEEKGRQVLEIIYEREASNKLILSNISQNSSTEDVQSESLKKVVQRSKNLILRYKELDRHYKREISEIYKVQSSLKNQIETLEGSIERNPQAPVEQENSFTFTPKFGFETPLPAQVSTPRNTLIPKVIEIKPDPDLRIENPEPYLNRVLFPPEELEMANPQNQNQAAMLGALMARNVDISSLPKFGESVKEDIVEFLDRLELSLQFYDLTDLQKARVIPLVLKGRAYTFYLTRPQATKDDYQLLTDELREEFNAPELLYRKRQELYSIRQNKEPISTYLERVEKLAQNLDIEDQSKLDIMISGLDKKYRTYIQMKQPENYSAATRALLLKEAINPPQSDDMLRHVLETVQSIKDSQNKVSETKNHFKRETPQVKQRNNPPRASYQSFHPRFNSYPQKPKASLVCYYCGRNGHTSKECRVKINHTANVPQNVFSQNVSRTNPQSSATNRPVNIPKSNSTCYKCGIKGHYARECINPPIKQE